MYEFAKVGAVVQQTEDSFDGLIDKLGVTPDLLDDLREASDGTISDIRLMSATTTLLAGAQGDLGSALASATPELLEIAKAANKLNPSLGDTAFLYESLATGIKRASPMILDNLGLTIKIGEANEKYAESIGKTVEQLTAEEQKLALLAEARRAGKVLVEQAGGAADSATDDFAQLEVTVENLTNALKKDLVPAAGEVATALLHMATGAGSAEKTMLDMEIDRIGRSNLQYQEKVERINELVEGYNQFVDAQGDVVQGYWEENEQGERVIKTTGRVIRANAVLTNAQKAAQTEQGKALRELVRARYDTADATDYQSEAQWRAADAIRNEEAALAALTATHRGITRAAKETIDQEYALELQTERNAYQQRLFNEELGELAIKMRGNVGREMEDYAETQADLATKARELKDKIEDLKASEEWPSEEALVQLKEWRDELTRTQTTIDETAEAHRLAMNQIIFDMTLVQAQADGLTDAEMTVIRSLAEGLGLVDPETAEVWGKITEHMSGLTDANIGETVDDVLALTSGLRGAKTATAALPAIGLVENFGMLAESQIAAIYGETTTSVTETASTVTDEIGEMETAVLELTDPKYEMLIDIKDRDLIIDSVASLEGMTKYLEGSHTIRFKIATTGEWPGGGGSGPPPATVTPGGRAYPSAQVGGEVVETGLAFVHAGELIIPPIEAQQMREGGGGTTITEGDVNNFNLNVTSVQELSSIMQEFAIMQAMAG
jgi:hypothetical protein